MTHIDITILGISTILKFMTSKKPTWIPVATGILRKGSLVLVGQRPEGHTLAGQWEFPGGKIELGEQPKEALQRELFEELGIKAEIGDLHLRLACDEDVFRLNVAVDEAEFVGQSPDVGPKSDALNEAVDA